ncbi:MAG TPA: hypothetical protein VNS58_11055 [Puia sp.]|nr:hypothetical protein [Puia sp.]
MTLWNDMIIGLCLVLLGWLLWKEFRRINRLRLPARVAASVVAVISLACLALPITYTAKKGPASSGKEGVLLTEGYDPDSLRQLLQTARAGGGFPDVFIDTGATGIHRLSKLHVLGYGLTRKEWAALRPPPLVFHPSPFSAGILSVSWKEKLAPGERCRIQGRVSLVPGKPVKLLLTGMGLPLDSVVIAAGQDRTPSGKQDVAATSSGKQDRAADRASSGKQHGAPASAGQTDFELTTIPAQSGRSVYRLWVLGGEGAGKEHANGKDGTLSGGSRDNEGHVDTLEQESLPIEVLPAQKLKILLLASSPDFENTFLVNWLSRSGHAVATRTAISKGKSDKAFLNMPETTLDPLTPSVLDKFDLVIADAAALSSGNAAEGSSLRRQVAEKGMGLIIRADSAATVSSDPGGSGAATFYKNIFPLETVKDSTQRTYIKERPGTQALLRDSSSRILVSSGLYGSGKLVFTTLNNTYSRMLSGEKKAYAAYWSQLLQKATRDAEPGEEWLFTPDLPRVNEPVAALLQTNKSGLPQGQFGAHTLYLAQAPLLPFQWQGTWWPAVAGWQSAATPQGEPCWWYVWPEADWRNVHRRQRREETREYIAEQAANLAATDRDLATTNPGPTPAGQAAANRTTAAQDADSERVPVSPTWFYALFIFSCLFLWVERKI